MTWNELAHYGLPPVGFVGKAAGLAGGCDRTSSTGCTIEQGTQRYNAYCYRCPDG